MTDARPRTDPLPLAAYRPRSELVLDEHVPEAARYPAIDAHAHLGRWLSSWVGREGEWLLGNVDDWLAAAPCSRHCRPFPIGSPSLVTASANRAPGTSGSRNCRR